MTTIDKIRAEIDRRITDNTFGAKLELMDILSFLDTLEEPVSDCHDLEEAAETHVKNKYCLTKLLGAEIQEAVNDFIAGAEWQKDNDTRDMFMSDNRHFQKVYELGKKDMKDEFEKNRLAACDSLTKEEYDREMDFTTKFIEEHHRTPTFSDAINYGMKLQKEQMMKEDEQ